MIARAPRKFRVQGLSALLLLAASAACGSEPVELPEPDVVILLSCDTLRADRLGAYGSDRGLTPNLDALAAESVVFTDAYAPAPFTMPSVSSMVTGRYPREMSIAFNEHVVPRSVPTLATFLEARGFENGAVVSNFVLRGTTGLDQGFGDNFDDEMDAQEVYRNAPERRAASTTKAALDMADRLLASGSERIFLWVHYQDPHGPYTPPPDLLEEYLPRELQRSGGSELLPLPPPPDPESKKAHPRAHTGIGWIPDYQVIERRQEVGYYVAAYDAEVRHMDDQLGRLIDGLKERGLYDDALVVFTADHGEGMGERDYWFAHGEHLTDGCVRVPLFFRMPGLRPDERSDSAALVDIVPTVLNRVGDTSPNILLGRDLLASGADENGSTVYISTLGSGYTPKLGFVDDGWKLVCEFGNGPQNPPSLYTLQRLDGDETNVAPENQDTAQELSARMNQFVEQLSQRQRIVRAQRTSADEERQKTLVDQVKDIRGLGYVGEEDMSEDGD